jgi:hypothetical protein
VKVEIELTEEDIAKILDANGFYTVTEEVVVNELLVDERFRELMPDFFKQLAGAHDPMFEDRFNALMSELGHSNKEDDDDYDDPDDDDFDAEDFDDDEGFDDE